MPGNKAIDFIETFHLARHSTWLDTLPRHFCDQVSLSEQDFCLIDRHDNDRPA